MNKDPAIERMIAVNELTEILCGKPCDICSFYGQRTKCMPVYTAEKIIDAGWRKASDVAREIFEEIERVAMSKIDADLSIEVLDDTYYIEAIDELKKKYTESEDTE